MRLLALETSDRVGSLALFDGERLLAACDLPPQQRTAQTLTPRMVELAAKVGWKLRQVERVAVAIGPGSFTGLRIGATAAKTLAYAAGAELLGVHTLEALAANAFAAGALPADARLWVVMDAQRSQLFAACYQRGDGPRLHEQAPTQIVEPAALGAAWQPGDWLGGPMADRLGDALPSETPRLDAAFNCPTATMIGRLAWQRFVAGEQDDPFQLVPQYYRLSAAEEKRQANKT